MAEEKDTGRGIIVGGVGGTLLGATLAALLLAKPAEAAPPEEKLNFLIEALTALIQVLAEVAEGQATLIESIQQWLAAQGVPPGEGIEVTVLTRWVAKEPEEIFSQAILSTGTFYSDRMVDWQQGKRIVFKAESSLNQAVQIQAIGNITDDINRATDIGAPQPCPAGGNISIGPAWDDWQPYIGVKISVAAAPTSGMLTISAVVQE